MKTHLLIADLSGKMVDTHAHVFHSGLNVLPTRRHPPDYDATLDTYLGLLDANGFSHGVLVQPSFLGRDNSFLLESLERAQGRCRGVVVLDPEHDVDQLKSMNDAGVVGIRLNLFGIDPPDLRAASWQRLLEMVNVLDWHVEVHCPIEQLPSVANPLLAQGCKIVVDHFGRPDFNMDFEPGKVQALLEYAATGRVWVKLSAEYRIWPEQNNEQIKIMVGLFMQHFSSQRLMWGSDWPHTEHETLTSYRASLNWLLNSIENPDDVLQMLCDTPKSLFKF